MAHRILQTLRHPKMPQGKFVFTVVVYMCYNPFEYFGAHRNLPWSIRNHVVFWYLSETVAELPEPHALRPLWMVLYPKMP